MSVTVKTFSSGGHGFGFKTTFTYHRQMLQSLTDWLQGLDGVITSLSECSEYSDYSEHSGSLYDLSGRKIANCKLSNSKLPKGIYILNNRKIAVK